MPLILLVVFFERQLNYMSHFEVVHILPSISRHHKAEHHHYSYAPFLSTVQRSPKVKKSESPGPGYYERQPPKPIERQNNSMMSYLPGQQGSAAFRDASRRFRQCKSNSPGPAHYSLGTKHRTIKKGSPNSLEYYRIKFPQMYSQNKSVSIQCYTKSRRQRPTHAKRNSKQKHAKANDWPKCKEDRFKQKSKEDTPGPGAYFYDAGRQTRKPRNYLSSEFSSKSSRSFMDNIVYQSNNDSRVPVNLYKKDESMRGSYELDSLFEISEALSKGRPGLINEQKAVSVRKRRVKLSNLSNLFGKNIPQGVEPMLRIQEIGPSSSFQY